MKKIIIMSLLFIGLGFILGEIIFSDKIELIKKLQKGETYYLLEEGIYNDYNTLQNNINHIGKKCKIKTRKTRRAPATKKKP